MNSLLKLRSVSCAAMALACVNISYASDIEPNSNAAAASARHASLPLRFEPNVGQIDPSVDFMARGNGYTMFLTPKESVLVFGAPAHSASDAVSKTAAKTPAVLRMQFSGANPAPELTGVDALPGITNYFIGSDPEKWRTDIVAFAKVRYAEIYPGIDLVYYGNARNVEYDFVLAAGADAGQIRMKIVGAERMAVNADGELVLGVAGGELRQPAPLIYQQGTTGKTLVSGSYVLHGKEVGFALGAYDRTRALVIDPVLIYSTYLGGSGFDQVNSIHVGPTGDAYVTGVTSSANFPLQGTPSSAYGGSQDLFVTKLRLAGSGLTYSTYIGGIGDDIGNDIVVSGAGTAYVTGSTTSINYPVVTPTIAAQVGGTDAFLTKLTAAGNGIVYSTYWGSTGFEEGTAVTVDPADNAYISGNTSAPNFPTQTAFQAALAGGMDAFMTKFSVAGNSIVYSTYLGGAQDDRATDMRVADDAAVFVIGSTTSANFPIKSPALQGSLGGGRDAFLTHFSLAGNALLYSTFIGGASDDEALGMTIDAPMNAYVTGRTASVNFPTQVPMQGSHGGGATDAFAIKINPPGSAIVFSTFLGGLGDDSGHSVALDTTRNVFLTGSTTSGNFPLLLAFQNSLGGATDAFVTKLALSGSALIYSTYLGGISADAGHGIGVDLVGNAYVAGYTESINFPTTAAFQSAFGAVRDGFVSKIAETNDLDLIFADGFESQN